jgi:ribosome assembly protein YihI (activator of Der GTPase)
MREGDREEKRKGQKGGEREEIEKSCWAGRWNGKRCPLVGSR